MIDSKERRFKVGDIVSLKGEREFFEITDWFYECSYNNIDGWYERSSFTIKGQKSGKFIDLINEDDKDVKLEKRSSKPMLPLPSGRKIVQATSSDEDEVLEEIFSLDFYMKPLTPEEVDFLLDKYNDFMNVHLLLRHIGHNESEYMDMANQILTYLYKT